LDRTAVRGNRVLALARRRMGGRVTQRNSQFGIGEDLSARGWSATLLCAGTALRCAANTPRFAAISSSAINTSMMTRIRLVPGKIQIDVNHISDWNRTGPWRDEWGCLISYHWAGPASGPVTDCRPDPSWGEPGAWKRGASESVHGYRAIRFDSSWDEEVQRSL